jgi:hypothetical protein
VGKDARHCLVRKSSVDRSTDRTKVHFSTFVLAITSGKIATIAALSLSLRKFAVYLQGCDDMFFLSCPRHRAVSPSSTNSWRSIVVKSIRSRGTKKTTGRFHTPSLHVDRLKIVDLPRMKGTRRKQFNHKSPGVLNTASAARRGDR